MSKLKITQQQYNTILLREQQSRLKTSDKFLNENLTSEPELIEEGWKEVVLGVAMMLGVGLTGQNKLMAQDAVKNQATMSQIKATLEDTAKLDELVDALESKGMRNADEKLADNAEKVMDEFNKIAKDNKIKYHVDTKVVDNLQSLKSSLGQGYAVKSSEISTDTVKGVAASVPIKVTDNLEINLGNDNLFISGNYTLSPAGVDTITNAINEIKKQGGKIQSVNIESSTDAEEIVKFKNESDPTGNIQLANFRTKSIANLIGSMDNVAITHREIPNNGSDVVSTQQFLKYASNHKATEQLRDKTAKFRYVKLKIVATFESDTTDTQITPPSFIKHYRFELVKIIESTGKTKNIPTKANFKHKKYKCTKSKLNVKSLECTVF